MNNPGEISMDNGGSSEDEASECSGGSGSTEPLSNTSRENDVEDDAASEDSRFKAPPPPTVEPKPQAHRCRKGRKTQIMEALDKGLDCFAQNDKTHDYEKERLEWEKEVERNRMELEKKHLDFEMKWMETEDRRAKENRQLMLQLFQCFRPPPPLFTHPYMAPQHFPYPPPHHGPSPESMDFSPIAFTAPGTPGPAAHLVHYYTQLVFYLCLITVQESIMFLSCLLDIRNSG